MDRSAVWPSGLHLYERASGKSDMLRDEVFRSARVRKFLRDALVRSVRNSPGCVCKFRTRNSAAGLIFIQGDNHSRRTRAFAIQHSPHRRNKFICRRVVHYVSHCPSVYGVNERSFRFRHAQQNYQQRRRYLMESCQQLQIRTCHAEIVHEHNAGSGREDCAFCAGARRASARHIEIGFRA